MNYWTQEIKLSQLETIIYNFPVKTKIYYAKLIKEKPKIKNFTHKGDLQVPSFPINSFCVGGLSKIAFDYKTKADYDLAFVSSLEAMKNKETKILEVLGKHVNHIIKLMRLSESWLESPCIYTPSKCKLLCYIDAAYFGFNLD